VLSLLVEFEAMTAKYKEAQKADGGRKSWRRAPFEISRHAAKEIIGFKHVEDIPGIDYGGFVVLRKRPPYLLIPNLGGASGNDA